MEEVWVVVQERNLLGNSGAFYDEDIKVVRERLMSRTVIRVTFPVTADRDGCLDLYMNHLTARALRDQLDVLFDDSGEGTVARLQYQLVEQTKRAREAAEANVETTRQLEFLRNEFTSWDAETRTILDRMVEFVPLVGQRIRLTSVGFDQQDAMYTGVVYNVSNNHLVLQEVAEVDVFGGVAFPWDRVRAWEIVEEPE